MSDAPLPKPDHLRSEQAWLARNPAAAIAVALGAATLCAALMFQQALWSTPDGRITVPGFGLTAAASIVSLVRRERAYGVWMLGLGLAAASIVLGWLMMFILVVGVTAALIAILHSVF